MCNTRAMKSNRWLCPSEHVCLIRLRRLLGIRHCNISLHVCTQQMPVWQLFAPFSWLNDEASTRYVLYVFQNQPAALQVSKQDIDFSCPGSIYVSLILIVSRFLMLMFFPSGRGWRDLLYDNDRAGRKGKKGHALFICQQRSFIACNSVNGFEGLTAAQGHVFQY